MEIMPYKLRKLYKSNALKEDSKLENDPVFKLPVSLTEIQNILHFSNFTKYLYLNVKNVHDLLYDLDETLNVDNQPKEKDLSFYFYLLLLIKHNPDIVNYKYSLDFIKEINKKKKKKNNYYLRNIIISKIILELISNFEGFDDEIDNSGYEEEIAAMIRENKAELENNLKLIEYMNLDLTKKYIIDNNVDEIYIDIIIQLIKNDKLSDYEFSFNIITQLNFEKIDLNEKMLSKLSNVLNSNEKNVEKYFIKNTNDLLDNKIVNFHYILLKYILKNSVYIYQIPFLLKIHINIKKIINSNIYEIISNESKVQDKERLEYILKKYSDLIYFNKLLDLKFTNKEDEGENEDEDEDEININEIEPDEQNKKDNLNNVNKDVNNKSTKSSTNKIIENESKREEKEEEYDPEKDIQKRLFQYSIFILHTNEKEKEPYIIVDKILLGKSKIEITENILNEIEKSNKSNENFKSFLNFLNQIKNTIKFEFQYNYCLKIKLQFEIDENEPMNENSIYNISCQYTFYNPIDKSKKTFKDDNILINTTLPGFSYMIEEINDESFSSLEYEFDENNQKITELNKNNIISNSFLQQNNYYSINNDNNSNYNSSNNSFIQNENKGSTKPSTDYDYFNIEAEQEEILIPIKIINNKDKLSDFLMELNNGEFISYGKDNKLIVYDHKYFSNEIKNLDECIYNISEKNSDSEIISEIIVCCVNNIYLINIKNNQCISLKKIQISRMNFFLCYELKENHYVISGENLTIYCVDIFRGKKQKSKSQNNKIITKDVFRSGIKISDNVIALTSNSVIKHGQDNLLLYNIETGKEKKIFGYSYFYGTTGLSLMNIKGRKILLCACKKYFPEQNNGIVLIDLSTINNENISERYFDTGNFEVNCFKPILDVKNKTMDKYGEESSEGDDTEFFFAGGFDEEKGEAIIQLYKVYYDSEEDLFSIEYLQDIEFKSHNIFNGVGSIISIQQSKINGNILANSSDGYIYLFSKPNIKYYLEEADLN